jgi:hypothetical protein
MVPNRATATTSAGERMAGTKLEAVLFGPLIVTVGGLLVVLTLEVVDAIPAMR